MATATPPPTQTSQTSQPGPSSPPPAPNPSSDPRLFVPAASLPTPSSPTGASSPDLSNVTALEALRLLSSSIEQLVLMTGDVPPTPPPKTPHIPQMSGMQAEKVNIVRRHSEKNLAVMREKAEEAARATERPSTAVPGGGAGTGGSGQAHTDRLRAYKAAMMQSHARSASQLRATPAPVDGVALKEAPKEPYIVIGEDSQPLNEQHNAITRKFYSKNPPPISVAKYLDRVHQFCPMSSAVYLATSLYIYRLAVEERAIAVTSRNAHRLLLAGLRVAMKALEDLSYPHKKMAAVGGVSEVELARLEISFCFLAGFELVVRGDEMRRHWEVLSGGGWGGRKMDVMALRIGRRKKEVRETKREVG